MHCLLPHSKSHSTCFGPLHNVRLIQHCRVKYTSVMMHRVALLACVYICKYTLVTVTCQQASRLAVLAELQHEDSGFGHVNPTCQTTGKSVNTDLWCTAI